MPSGPMPGKSGKSSKSGKAESSKSGKAETESSKIMIRIGVARAARPRAARPVLLRIMMRIL